MLFDFESASNQPEQVKGSSLLDFFQMPAATSGFQNIERQVNVESFKNFEVYKPSSWKRKFAEGKNLEQLKLAVGDIQEGECLQFMTNGAWSSHDMIEFFLRKIGCSDVFLTSWAVSEQAARRVVKLHEEGLISDLTCLFDYRIKDRKYEPVLLFEKIGKVSLTKIHAKVIILQNSKTAITIVSSANLSKNPRVEAGAIFSCPDSANFHKKWIVNQSLLESSVARN